MSQRGTADVPTTGSGPGRVIAAWQSLSGARRLAALAAVGLFVTLFLPWYQQTVIAKSATSVLQSTSVTLTGWGAFSFAEALLLLTAAAVLVLLFKRAEGGRFRLPGGDGAAIIAAGSWASLLIVWRIFDKQGTDPHAQYATASGVEWGIFFALAVAVLLAYSGSRIRAANEPEPESPHDGGLPFWGPLSPAPGSPGSAESPPADEPSAASDSDPTATRVSQRERPGEAPPPTRVSQREASDGAATRVSGRERSSNPIGPPVIPEDPPTMRLRSGRDPASRSADEQLTMPLERDPDA
jgi:hypothetical protein